MPKIPRVVARESLPGVSGQVRPSVAEAGGGARAIAGVFAAGSEFLADRREQINRRDRLNKEIFLRNSFRDEQREFVTGEFSRIGEDTFDNQERGKEFRKQSIEKFTREITDPALKASVSEYINNRSGNMLDDLARYQQKQRAIVTNQAIETTLDGISKDTFTGSTQLGDAIGEFRNVISAQLEAGAIDETAAQDLIVKGDNVIASSFIDGLIQTDPEAAIEVIDSGIIDEYLSKKEIDGFQTKAKRLSAAIERDEKAAEKERKKIAKEELEKAQQETGNEFLVKLLDGTLTQAEVLSSNLEPTGDKNSKEKWIKQIEARTEKLDDAAKEAWKTDPEVLADFQSRIFLDPASVEPEEILNAQGSGLSTDDAKSAVQLLQKQLKVDNPEKTKESQAAFKILDDLKRNNIFDDDDEENSLNWARNVQLVSKFIQNNPDKDPIEFVQKIREPVVQGKVDNWLDAQFFTSEEKAKEEEVKRQRLEREAEGLPTLTEREQEIIQRYRDAGATQSDEEILQFYREKYGE